MKIDVGNTLKSKTIRGLLIVAIAFVVNIFAISPQEVQQVAPSIDEMTKQINDTQDSSNSVEFGSRLAEILGLLYAAYGRAVAQQPLVKKKEGESNETT